MLVAANLLQSCCLVVIKLISGFVCIACFRLMITSLLQVVNKLGTSWLPRLFIHKLISTSCSKSVHKYQVATSLIFTDLLQLDEVNRLAASWWQTYSKLVKSTTCSKSVVFLAVYVENKDSWKPECVFKSYTYTHAVTEFPVQLGLCKLWFFSSSSGWLQLKKTPAPALALYIC